MRRRRGADGTQAKYASHLAYFERWARGREADTISADEIENVYLDLCEDPVRGGPDRAAW
jgi:hypothetical protein